MLSSKKILYLIILSLVVVCGVSGIDLYAGAYDQSQSLSDEIITFSDSGVFDVPEYMDSTVAIVSEDEGSSAFDNADIYIPDEVDETTEPGGVTSLPEETTQPSEEPTTPGDVTTEPESTSTQATTQSTQSTTVFTTTHRTTIAPITTQQTTRTTATTTVAPVMTSTTTTTTAYTTAATTTEAYYEDSGSVHFAYPTIRIYAGASVNVNLEFPIGAQRRANFSSRNPSVATVNAFDDTTATVTGLSVGTAWIQATSSSGDVAYCKVIVTDFAEEVIRLTNVERAKNGLPALTQGGALVQTVANTRLSESSKYFSHTRPNGSKFSSIAGEIGLTYAKIGENLAAGQTTPEQVVSEWMASPTHRGNILDADYTQICVAYGIGPDNLPYWVQTFYKPAA